MVKLKRKINLAKGLRKIKRIRIKIDIKIIIINLWLNDEVEKNKNFFFGKGLEKKN